MKRGLSINDVRIRAKIYLVVTSPQKTYCSFPSDVELFGDANSGDDGSDNVFNDVADNDFLSDVADTDVLSNVVDKDDFIDDGLGGVSLSIDILDWFPV